MNRAIWISLSLCFLFGKGLFAQGVDFFSSDPAKFIQEFTNALNQEKGELGNRAANAISPLWTSGGMQDEEKTQFIELTNIMVSRRLRTSPDLSNFALIYSQLKMKSSYVQLDPRVFMEVSKQAAVELEPARSGKFFRVLLNYIQQGYPVKRDKFYWFASETQPKLKFISLEEKGVKYLAPVIRYSNTDLYYRSNPKKDSTIIRGTSGDFNLLALTFAGVKGRVDWSKLGLDKDDVYCDFRDYKLNFNYGLIKVDTVDFYYKSLISEPLIGKFEDRNVGFKSLNKANYPYFKSHEGGVVIENFIPNIRYEGGFSLQGIRKIGTAFDIWEDYVAPANSGDPEQEDSWYSDYSASDAIEDEKKDDEWGEDQWDYSSDQSSSFESDDSDWGNEDWEYDGEEENIEEGFEGATEESAMYPSLVQKHIPAKLEIQRRGQTVMKLAGEAFVLDMDKMVGNNMAAVVYTSDQDSIHHPGMDVVYTAMDTTVTLKKSRRGTYRSVPFTSSFHEYFLYFESIVWDMRKDELKFTAFVDRENKVSAIESFDYFTKARFSQFKNILKFNPIGAIHRYNTIHPDQPIYPGSIMAEYRLEQDLPAFERALPGLEGSGFITYDKKTKEITPLPKLTNWALAARKKKDYDAIQLISKVDSGAHASLDLETMTIHLSGVPFFSLSDSVYLRVVPLEGKVSVQKNRQLQFGGAMASGNINFYSSKEDRPSFTFDYESYKIMCDSLDSIRFVLVRNPPPGYEPTPFEKALSNTVFEGITGAIHIDDPNNKSGEKNYPHFPVFDSYSRSYLYWEKPHIENGVYKKEKMNFSLDPFVLPNIEKLEADDLSFEGEFFSSEIFPKFRQTLQVMSDGTLGFEEETPPRGYSVYDNNGRFFNKITLDGKGLRGEGRVEYLGTVAKSDSFIFHFDSVMAEVHYFNMQRGYRGGVYFPKVDANTAKYIWFTKDSALAISSTYEALSIFDGEAKFSGTLSITEKGMVGDGEIVLGQIKVVDDSIIFKDMDFTTKDSDFIIVDKEDPNVTHFIAEGVDVTYDVFRHKTSFETKEVGKQLATFPMHQYSTSLAKGAYQRSTNDLKIEGISSYLKDNFFVSIDPVKDSLRFKAKDAYYNVETKEVEISGVPYIYVADAMITTEEQEIVIEPDGKLRTLENALIEADQESKLHRIYEATVDIYSRNEYEGAGKYDYIEVNGKEQFIQFDNIKVNSDTTTIASGDIKDIQEFYLTERIFFRGNTQLDASRKFLSFEGEVKIESENPVFKGAWFTFERTIVNPDSVFIPISDDLTDAVGDPLTVGLNFVPENRVFYSNFLQAKEDDDDVEILTASGGLTFDRRKKEFRIGQEDKLKNRVFKGATVSFNDAQNSITSQGFLNFPYDFMDKTITMKMAGAWKEDMRKRQLSTDLAVGIDMGILPKDPLQNLANAFKFLTETNKNIDFNQRSFLENISELLDEGKNGERETAKFLVNVQNSMVYTDVKLAQQLPYTLLLSGVNFNYSRDEKALFCDDEIGLIGINGTPINKMINAKIVYNFGRIDGMGEKEPDQLTVYLEIDEFNYVYFHFEDDVIYTTSNFYDDYNYPLQEVIDKQKSAEGYRFEVATDDEVSRFRQDFVVKFIK